MFKIDETTRRSRKRRRRGGRVGDLPQGGLPGCPGVPKHVEGKAEGSIQPIVSHTGTVVGAHASWSQADVDALVRYPRGELGGRRPRRQRQEHAAHARWGSRADRPRPGVEVHRPRQARRQLPPEQFVRNVAARLPPGVPSRSHRVTEAGRVDQTRGGNADHRRFEKISDEDFRTIIEPAAKLGAKSDLPWVGPMTKKAQKRFETATPTSDQIAETFVETIVERKQNLRKDFAKFFTSLGFAGAEQVEMAVA